jgi:hypothetical protein
VVLAAQSRWHLTRLDQTAPARAQLRTLLGLVHRARSTLFGREHDFRRIRSVADFRRLVPLRTPIELWREYGQTGQTWPGEDTDSNLSRELLTSHRRAVQTALALVLRVRPHSRLLAGPILWLREDGPCAAERCDGRFPGLIRNAVRRDFNGNSPTCLVGSAERIIDLLDRIDTVRGDNAWPELAAVLYRRPDTGFDLEALRDRLPKSVVLLEMLDRPEGPVAIEDPRYGRMRLLSEHGVYFELVAAGTAGLLQPPRLGLDEASTGVVYEVAISSPGGVWACRSGLHVCFDQLSPPLFRVVPAPVTPPVADASGSYVGAPTFRTDEPAPTPAQRSHRQNGGSPAAPPGSFVRTPWSAPADRG